MSALIARLHMEITVSACHRTFSLNDRTYWTTCSSMWESPKIRGVPYFGILISQDPTNYLGYYIRVPYFRKTPISGFRGDEFFLY